ncbi:MAG TPA: hypothetical protein VF670_11805 [Duganella sp.]|jgi:hypothetical protein
MHQLPTTTEVNSYNQPDVAAESGALASSAAASLAHAATAQRLTHRYAASMANNGALTLALATRMWDPAIWGESLQMEAAIARRLHGQGLDFRKGCTVLLEDYRQIQQANTMSKLMEKQGNLATQFAQLLTSQTTSFVSLLENIDVDYGYWASQKQGSAQT